MACSFYFGLRSRIDMCQGTGRGIASHGEWRGWYAELEELEEEEEKRKNILQRCSYRRRI